MPDYDLFGEIRGRIGTGLTNIVPSNTYATRDGKSVVIGGNADPIYKRLMHAIGRDDLGQDPALATNVGAREAHGRDRRRDRRVGRGARSRRDPRGAHGGRRAARKDLHRRRHRRTIRSISRAR